jgi:hypothetical protein
MNRNIIFLSIIGTFLILGVTTTTFPFEYNFPQLHMTQSKVKAVEGQVEEGEHEEEVKDIAMRKIAMKRTEEVIPH